jgi:hypothetical protein
MQSSGYSGCSRAGDLEGQKRVHTQYTQSRGRVAGEQVVRQDLKLLDYADDQYDIIFNDHNAALNNGAFFVSGP